MRKGETNQSVLCGSQSAKSPHPPNSKMKQDTIVLEDIEAAPPPKSRHPISGLFLAPRISSLLLIGVLFAWLYQAQGGVGIRDTGLFGLHALLMSLFVLVFTQEATLSFAAPLLGSLTSNKAVFIKFHITCHILGLLSAIGGLVAIVYYKNLAPPTTFNGMTTTIFPFFHLYSPHSWLGIAFLALYSLQFALSIFKVQSDKLHRFVGRCLFAVGYVITLFNVKPQTVLCLPNDGFVNTCSDLVAALKNEVFLFFDPNIKL